MVEITCTKCCTLSNNMPYIVVGMNVPVFLVCLERENKNNKQRNINGLKDIKKITILELDRNFALFYREQSL